MVFTVKVQVVLLPPKNRVQVELQVLYRTVIVKDELLQQLFSFVILVSVSVLVKQILYMKLNFANESHFERKWVCVGSGPAASLSSPPQFIIILAFKQVIALTYYFT